MIRFILLQNRQGKTRLSKWYTSYTDEEKIKISSDIHRSIIVRDKKWTNIIEYQTSKVVYRQYAGLIFTFCVDVTDNEMSILELIHLFVEILDTYFSNVCELDLVFSFDKVYNILDEIVLAGEVCDTSKEMIMKLLKDADKMD
eukprot:Platyproteum_vivax@DN2105_c0_g1_i1.p1